MIFGLSLGYLITKEEVLKHVKTFIKEIDDWSLCDSPASNLKIIKTNNDYFIKIIKEMLESNKEFETRFGLVLLLFHYMNEKYIDYILEVATTLKSDAYYINMAIAWLLCECFIKYPKKSEQYIDQKYLSKFVLNKTISKINDSYRVTQKDKDRFKKKRI